MEVVARLYDPTTTYTLLASKQMWKELARSSLKAGSDASRIDCKGIF